MQSPIRSSTRPLPAVALAIAVCAATVAASPAPQPSTSSTGPAAPVAASTPALTLAPADPAVTARAKNWLERVRANDIDRSQLDERMRAALTSDVAASVARQATALGPIRDFVYVERRAVGTVTMYLYRVTFPATSAIWVFAVDPDGKIAGLSVSPAPAPL